MSPPTLRRAVPLLLALLVPPLLVGKLRAREDPGTTGVGDQVTPPTGADTLTLEEAVRIGLGENPDIRVRRAEREATSGQRLATWGAFLPDLSAGASFGRSDFTTRTYEAPDGTYRETDSPVTDVTKSSSQSLGLSWTLLDGGGRIAELRSGAASMDAAGHRVDLAERRTVADVRVAYFDALEQRTLVEVYRGQLRARRRDLELARKRYGIADADPGEILGARSDTLDARMQLLEARRLARARTRALRAAMGVEESRLSAGTPLSPVEPLPVPDTLNEERLVRRALRSHPELEALDADARAASADLWAARSDYLPTIDLSYGLSRSETVGTNGSFFVMDPSNDRQRLRLDLSWNLFDGFQREQSEQRASATVRQKRAERSKRRIELETTVRDRVEELRRRRERLGMLRRMLELARERVEVKREQFRLGDVSYLELQQVIEQLNATERQRITERYAYLRAWAELELVTGPLSPGNQAPPEP